MLIIYNWLIAQIVSQKRLMKYTCQKLYKKSNALLIWTNRKFNNFFQPTKRPKLLLSLAVAAFFSMSDISPMEHLFLFTQFSLINHFFSLSYCANANTRHPYLPLQILSAVSCELKREKECDWKVAVSGRLIEDRNS